MVSKVGGKTIVVSAANNRKTFNFPSKCCSLPTLTKEQFSEELNYSKPKGNMKRYHKKIGFTRYLRFLAILFGQCIFSQMLEIDAVLIAHLQCMYSIKEKLPIDWAEVIFQQRKKVVDKKGYVSILTKIVQKCYPNIYKGAVKTPYPENLIMKYITEEGTIAVKLVGSIFHRVKQPSPIKSKPAPSVSSSSDEEKEPVKESKHQRSSQNMEDTAAESSSEEAAETSRKCKSCI